MCRFDAHFQVDLAVQVDRNMPTGARDLLRTNYISNGTTGVRYDLRQFMWGCAAAHDCQRATAELFDLDDVFHGNTLRLRTTEIRCRAGGNHPISRKAVMPARSTSSARSAAQSILRIRHAFAKFDGEPTDTSAGPLPKVGIYCFVRSKIPTKKIFS